LPIAIDDSDRIEVTRGPNSAAYGPNSMLAIVNIVTRHPHDVERAYASVDAVPIPPTSQLAPHSTSARAPSVRP
jgi:outer membrane receptor for ferrienterochelin and colicin